jgi:hypothetical protein
VNGHNGAYALGRRQAFAVEFGSPSLHFRGKPDTFDRTNGGKGLATDTRASRLALGGRARAYALACFHDRRISQVEEFGTSQRVAATSITRPVPVITPARSSARSGMARRASQPIAGAMISLGDLSAASCLRNCVDATPVADFG